MNLRLLNAEEKAINNLKRKASFEKNALLCEIIASIADKSLKKGLKCIGNAGAYGPLVELNEQKGSEGVLLDVYSGAHYHQQTIREGEVPGSSFSLRDG